MEILVLGPLEVVGDDGPVAITSSRQRAVLAALVVGGALPVSVERLVDVVWPRDPPESALNSLQSHVARLRARLPGDAGMIATEPGGYRLALPSERIDAVRFERTVARAKGTDSAAERLAAVESALALWRGPPLPEFADGFARGWVRRLDQRHRAACELRAETLLDLGRAEEAAATLEPLVDQDPLWDGATALLLRSHAAAGRAADASLAYQRHREALADALGVDPSPRLEALHTAALRGELTSTPVRGATLGNRQPRPRGPAWAPPIHRSSFVGRSRELERLSELASAGAVVSVVGPGGVGKTRLVAEYLAARGASAGSGTADGSALWVDAADVDDGAALVQALVVAAGATPAPTEDPVATAAAELSAGPVTVVLDNVEHVIDAAAGVVESLLSRADEATVITTSRERLRVDGEQVLDLLPLARSATPTADDPAVRLFCDRAGPAVDPADANALRLIAEVVDRLDALPLAIELAATQVRPLGLPDLAARLDDRLELLTRGARGAGERHRTLRAVMESSWALLSPHEQVALRRLAVFPSAFSLEMAEAVLGDSDVPQSRVAALVAALVERSLVVHDSRLGHRLLETVRAYAIERLRASGEGDAVARRHAAATVAEAEHRNAQLAGPGEAGAVVAMTRLLPHLRQAERTARGAEDTDLRVRLAAAMYRYGYHRQHFEVMSWAEQVVGLDATGPRMATALAAAATFAWARGDMERAGGLAARGLEIAGDLEAPGLEAVHEVNGDVALVAGDSDAARGHFRAQAAVGRRTGRPAIESEGASGEAMVLVWSGDAAAGEAGARQALRLAQTAHCPSSLAIARYALGEALADRDPVQAVALLGEAAEASEEVDNRLFNAAALTALSATRSRHGDPRRALLDFREVLDRSRQQHNATLEATALRNLVVLLARVGADADALFIDRALQARGGQRLYPAEARRLDRARSAALERLGEDRAAEIGAQASTLSMDDILAVARRAVEQQLRRFSGQG